MASTNNRAGIMIGGFQLGIGPGSVGMSLHESVEDHLARARFFLEDAIQTPDEKFANWCLLAAVYSAVASFEITRTRYEENLQKDYALLLADARTKIRHFELLDIVRVHDFHRGAVGLSNSVESVSGPICGKTGSGANSTVGIRQDQNTGRITKIAERNASINTNRMLHAKGFTILDPAINEFVSLHSAIEEYIADLMPFIDSHFPVGSG